MRFMAWLSLPKALKRPKTQRDFAKEIGVGEDTLSDWKKVDGFQDEVTRQAREYMRQHVPDVLGVITQHAKTGSIAHLNMFLSMTGLADDVEAAGKGPMQPDDARSILYERLARRLDRTEP